MLDLYYMIDMIHYMIRYMIRYMINTWKDTTFSESQPALSMAFISTFSSSVKRSCSTNQTHQPVKPASTRNEIKINTYFEVVNERV